MAIYEDEIKIILSDMPNEADYFDIKKEPYAKKGEKFTDVTKCELLKDIVAMANFKCDEPKHRYIIVGISNDSKEYVGIVPQEWPDDSTFQGLFKHIQPLVKINTGIVEFEGKYFGYFLIEPKTNEVYCIADSFKEDKGNKYKGKYFVRRGSITDVLTHAEFFKITNTVNKESMVEQMKQEDIRQQNRALAMAAMFGCWNEKIEGDRKFIESLTGMQYETWIQYLKKLKSYGNTSISLEEGIWKISERKTIWEMHGALFFDSDFTRFVQSYRDLFNHVEEKYKEEADQRWCSSKPLYYSHNLIQGVAEFLAIVGNNNFLPNCSYGTPRKLIHLVLDSVFAAQDWRVYASIQDGINFLAEADPHYFLTLFSEKLQDESGPLCEYFKEKETGVIPFQYGDWYIRTIEMLAMSKKWFGLSCRILFQMASFREDVLNSLVRILLPWRPATAAGIKSRIGIFRSLKKINEELAWKLLIKLLPRPMQTIDDNGLRPLYMESNQIDAPSVKDRNVIYEKYEEEAILLAEGHVDRIKELLDYSTFFYQPCFDHFYDLLYSEAGKNNDDEIRYSIWCDLLNKFNLENKGKGMPQSRLNRIKDAAKVWKPHSVYYGIKRLFDCNPEDIVHSDMDFRKQCKKIESLQIKCVSELFDSNGMTEILRLCSIVNNTASVGKAMALIKIDSLALDLERYLIGRDKKILTFAQSYILQVERLMKKRVLEFMKESWTEEAKYQFLLALPVNKEYWERANRILSEPYKMKYWQNNNIWFDDSIKAEDFDFLIDQFLAVGRWDKAAQGAFVSVYENRPCTLDQIEKVLLQPLSDEMQKRINSYTIKTLFEYVEKEEDNRLRLLDIGWRWFGVLGDSVHVIFEVLVEDASFFIMLLVIQFRPDFTGNFGIKTITPAMGRAAFDVLYRNKLVPGLKNGEFDEAKFLQWYKLAEDMAVKYDMKYVVDSYIGYMLFNAMGDYDGFCLPEKLADFLEEDKHGIIRKGFALQAYNALGVHFVDANASAENSASKKYEEKAESADDLGYVTLAGMFREIALAFHDEAADVKLRFGMRKDGLLG